MVRISLTSTTTKLLSNNGKVTRFLNQEISAFPGADAAIMILTTIATTLAYVGAMSLLIDFMASEFTYLTTRVPNFEFQIINGEETGNSSFLVFSVLRDVAFWLFLFVFFLFGILLVLKQAQLASNETMKNMLQGAVTGIIILMIFPYIWDPISDIAENAALSLMNPLYTFDENNPCPSASDTRETLFMQHMRNVAERSVALGISIDPDSMCRPDLLPNYLFAKALFGADQALEFTDESKIQWWDIGAKINAQLQVFSDSVFSILFVGMTKMSMLFFLTSMAVFVADMRFLLLDVIAVALPVLLALRCIPFFGIDKMAKTLTDIFVPLLFAPILAALILLAGATDLINQEEQLVTITAPDEIQSIVPDRFLFSLHAMATLALVVMSPILFVPMLSSISSMLGRMTMTGIMSGVMGTAGMAKSGISGSMAGFSGMKEGGGFGTGQAIKSMFTSPGSMGSVLGGSISGARGSMGAAFANDAGGAGRILPGAGGMSKVFGGSIWSNNNETAEERAYGDAYEKSSVGIRKELEEQYIAEAVDAHVQAGGSYTGNHSDNKEEEKQQSMDKFIKGSQNNDDFDTTQAQKAGTK